MGVQTGYSQYEESHVVPDERHRAGGMMKRHTIVAENAVIYRRRCVVLAEYFNGLEPGARFGADVDLE